MPDAHKLLEATGGAQDRTHASQPHDAPMVFLGWAEDFPAEAAADAVRILVRGGQKGVGGTRRARPHFDEEFVDKHVPEWSDLMARVLERG